MIRKEKLEELRDIINELKTVQVERRDILPKESFLQSIPYNFTLNNGIVIPREKLIKGGNDGSAAIIMPFISDMEILTVIEPRVFTDLTVGVGFPAGYIESGEDCMLGAMRELIEETGYVPSEITLIDSFYQDEGVSSALNHIFLAYGCEKKYKQKLDRDEVIRYMSFYYDELFELERLGYIMGGNAKLALEKSKRYVRRK